MNVKLLAHTQLSGEFKRLLDELAFTKRIEPTDGQAIALSAIRTCYSHNKPSEIVQLEGEKYFGQVASDGEGGTEADRLIRHIMRSGHLSTTEHITFTFAIEGVSRALLSQLTRHRVGFSYSVQSQRFVKMESRSKSKGFDYVVPKSIKEDESKVRMTNDLFSEAYDGTMQELFESMMDSAQKQYDLLRSLGVPAEDARAVLPNAATCNLVLTGNLRSILDFYSKRSAKGAQKEIKELAERIKDEVVKVEPWVSGFFE